MALPLRSADLLLGFITLALNEPAPQEELDLLQFIADLVAVVLTNEGEVDLHQFFAGLVAVTLAAVEQARVHRQVVQRLEQESRHAHELAQANQTLAFQALVIEHMSESIVVTDSQGRVTYWSPKAQALWGWTAREMLGKSLARLYPASVTPGLSGLSDLLRDEGPISREFQVVTKTGDLVWIEVITTVVRNDQGAPSGFLHIVRNITRRKEAEEHLLQTEKLRSLGQLASGIAHDLNNVLMLIQGHAELCLQLPGLMPQVRQGLEVVLGSAADGAEVVRRIQAFYQPADPADFQPLQLNQVITATAAQVESSLPMLRGSQSQRVQLKLELASLPLMAGNERELGQLLTNLLLNAVDAMPQGGTLAIATFHQDDRIIAVVQDTGTGMTEEVRRRIFEPFFTTKGEAGTGLGLSIAHGIAQQHGGEIQVRSQLGRGTTFTLSFPTLSAQGSSSPESALGKGSDPPMAILPIASG